MNVKSAFPALEQDSSTVSSRHSFVCSGLDLSPEHSGQSIAGLWNGGNNELHFSSKENIQPNCQILPFKATVFFSF